MHFDKIPLFGSPESDAICAHWIDAWLWPINRWGPHYIGIGNHCFEQIEEIAYKRRSKHAFSGRNDANSDKKMKCSICEQDDPAVVCKEYRKVRFAETNSEVFKAWLKWNEGAEG